MKKKKSTPKKGRRSVSKYVVEAIVKMKSKALPKAQADALRIRTKKQVKGSVVKVKKV